MCVCERERERREGEGKGEELTEILKHSVPQRMVMIATV